MKREPIYFKNRRYDWVEEIRTQFTRDYVPDWGISEALRESAQNAYDEQLMSGCEVKSYVDGQTLYLRDTGNGVHWKSILHIGHSGKRGVNGAVGKHGEGEVISFLAAARIRVHKVMASQNWLLTARFDEDGNDHILVLDRYESRTNRKGTAWFYDMGFSTASGAMIEHWDKIQASFHRNTRVREEDGVVRVIKSRKRRREPVFYDKYERGMLRTAGMDVNAVNGLFFGYDLDVAPGRDRGAFVWEQIEGNVQELFAKHVTADQLSELIGYALDASYTWYKEWTFKKGPDKSTVSRAVYRATGSRARDRLCWGRATEPALLADAQEQGIPHIVFRDAAPVWFTRVVPHVSEVVSVKTEKTSQRKPPADLAAACDDLLKILNASSYVGAVMVDSTMDDGTIACADGDTVVLNYRYAKENTTVGSLLKTLAHEAAHIMTSAPDLTRAHTSAMGGLLAGGINNMMSNENRELWADALEHLKNWSKAYGA